MSAAPVALEEAERFPLACIQKVWLPAQCVSGVIGKKGSVIISIKDRSGAHIMIEDRPEEKEGSTEKRRENVTRRMATVTGSEQSVRAAVHMMRERVGELQMGQPRY